MPLNGNAINLQNLSEDKIYEYFDINKGDFLGIYYFIAVGYKIDLENPEQSFIMFKNA